MHFNILLDDQTDVEAIRKACIQKLYGGGLTVTNWSNENTSIGKISSDQLTRELLIATEEFLLAKLGVIQKVWHPNISQLT